MNWKKSALILVTGLTLGLGLAGTASAETQWERNHPRRDQVIDRLHNQNYRIRDERADGDLTGRQAGRLHREDRAIFRQEQFEARLNHGHITRAEQRSLNQEENQVSRQIGR